MRIAISGASGLVGAALSRSLASDGHDVRHLVRRPARDEHEMTWDPHGGHVDTDRLDVDALVHLAGKPLGPARWTSSYKRGIARSRIEGTRSIAAALASMDRPPPRLVSGSAVGFYGDTARETVDETGPRGTGFLAEVVADWEAATEPARQAGVRVAHARTGLVLSARGGLLGTVLPLFRLGLGGELGDGGQYMSWISLRDEVRALRFLIERTDITGPVNLCAPAPVTNAEYTRAIGRELGRPAVMRVPRVAMRVALGEFADEAALVSQRAWPARLLEAGFSFHHTDIRSALSDILDTTAGA